MNTIDLVILVVVLISASISFLRGFAKEFFSLAAWMIAIWLAVSFVDVGALFLEPYINNPAIRVGTAFAILFLATLLLGTMVNSLIGSLIKKTGLSGTDRMVGLIFGAARGGAIIAVLVLLAGVTDLPTESWWAESQFLGHFEQMAFWLKDHLPPDVASNITYN